MGVDGRDGAFDVRVDMRVVSLDCGVPVALRLDAWIGATRVPSAMLHAASGGAAGVGGGPTGELGLPATGRSGLQVVCCDRL